MEYLPGSVKRHPDWPDNLTVAQRTPFEDEDETGCTSWLKIAPGQGTGWLREAQVASWPDVATLTLKKPATVPPVDPEPPSTP